MHSSLKKYQGERRESLPAQRGEACNSNGLLTTLTSSGEMHVFLRDSTGVLSRPAGNKAAPEMKNLYSKKSSTHEPTYPSRL